MVGNWKNSCLQLIQPCKKALVVYQIWHGVKIPFKTFKNYVSSHNVPKNETGKSCSPKLGNDMISVKPEF